MTEISFHTGIDDVLGYACRLLRKAQRQGARVAVCADADTLQQLDRALWTFDPIDFTPHVRLVPGSRPHERLAATPIRLLQPEDADGLRAGPAHEVLVNLGAAPVPGFESFERLLEIVGAEAEAADAGRRRWRHYAERGYAIEHHRR